MSDGLDSAFSLGRGFSAELGELADFDFNAADQPGARQADDQDRSAIADQDTEMFGGEVSGSAPSWDEDGDGSRDGAGGGDWLTRFGSASAPAAIGTGGAATSSAPPVVPGAVVITTYQGGLAPFDGLASDFAAGQHLFNSFGSGPYSGGGPSSSGSPRKEADAEEQRRLRRRTLNRESAKRARSRQRSQLEEAQAQVLALAADNERLQKQVDKAEAARDAATGQLAQARAQLAAAQHDGKSGQRGAGAAPPANTRMGPSGSGVGSSAGSGASEVSGALPPLAASQPPPSKSSDAAAQLMPPPPPPPQPSIPRLLPTHTQRSPRRKTRHHARPPPPTLRTTSAPAIAASSRWSQPLGSGQLQVRSAASAPAQQQLGYDTSRQPPPQLQMGVQPYYVVSTGIPTPAAPAPPPPRFQVPPPKPVHGSSDAGNAFKAAAGAPGGRSLRSSSRGGGSTPSTSPFSDMSDTPFR